MHKIYISPRNFESIIRACYNEEHNGMFYTEYDKLVNNCLNNNNGGTAFKIENETGALVGFFVMKNGTINDTYVRLSFRNNAYLSAVNTLTNEEMVLETNASLSFSRNKILN